ncbi:SMI1/KNR4 family protein [Chitinophaga agrisoli]|uniref:SMI1/KNR4 family protein n=1 Tax=Chitinophaga agrisoli TaxID=2607653 RepID=A0A5B2VZP2_9BACT|nr:SMI1/KNR4 family protein [Chitinophaga agrisoli]KAA2243802.1 SMI1/KNR4 family protein [Chitinophaga agrisoli]
MWYTSFEFYDRQPGLQPGSMTTLLSAPVSATELALLEQNLQRMSINNVHPRQWVIPQFTLPEELLQLLACSNGGGIVNGSREFGFFSLEQIREYYLHYHFPQYTPYFLPIAFNGGGIFYAYDYRQQTPPIVAISAGNLDAADSALLGYSLQEVLEQDTDIADSL